MTKLSESGDLLKCSFCGKSQKQVRKLIAGPGVYICDECIELCNEIIEEELGTVAGEVEEIELPKPKEIFGFPCAGYVRHIGIEKSSGQYISILDDDDYFFDVKISTQINEMQKRDLRICCSDALAGFGIFSHTSSYYFYLQGLNRASIKQVLLENNTYPNEVLPGEFEFDLIKRHNFVIHSSVVFERALYDSVSGYKNLCNGQEDHQLLMDMLRSSNCLYLSTPLLYYDTRRKHSLFHKILRYLKSKFK